MRNHVSVLDADLLARTAQQALKALVATYDPATGTFPSLGGGALIAYSTGPAQKDDSNATESLALFTFNTTPTTFKRNSRIAVRTRWSLPSGVTVRLRLRCGGAVLDDLTITGNTTLVRDFRITNRNSLSIQDCNPFNAASIGQFSASALTTSAVDLETAQQFTITAQFSAAGSGSNIAKLVDVEFYHWAAP